MGGRSAASLTQRERQVALLVATGLRNREIAQGLRITSGTVDGYLQAIYRKLGVTSRKHLANLLAGDPEARRLGAAPASALPEESSSFIGREDKVQELVDLAASRRLVTLTGPGGVGKTRVALRTARLLESRWALEAHLAELSPVSDDDLVDESVQNSLRLRHDRARSARDVITDHLGSRPTLLV